MVWAICAYRKSHLAQEATAAYRLQISYSGYLLGNNREAQEVHAAICEQGSLVVSGSENWNTCPGVRIAARTATFRLRVARSAGEVHQLAVWQRRLRVPAGARAVVRARPWPATGASWI